MPRAPVACAHRRAFQQAIIATLSFAVAMLAAPRAHAASITPNTFADDNASNTCSFRDAISSANNNTDQGGCVAQGSYGDDTIPLAAGTYTLSIPPDGTPDDNADGDLDIGGLGNLTILGVGAGLGSTGAGIGISGLAATTVDAARIDRVFDIGPSTAATIAALTIRNGNTGPPGAGINNAGTLTLSSSTLSGGFAGGSGGGLNNAGTANLTNVTISGNSADVNGGGLRNFSGATTLNNVTVSGNTSDADASGGGDGAINQFGGTINLKNTIVAGNQDASGMAGPVAPDCAGGPISQGHNLIGNTANCGFTPTTGDITGVDPLLGPLADNGGPTFTHPLLAGSPAIDKGGTDSAPTDQRGVPRNPDIGAYEFATCKGVVVNRVGTPGADQLTGTEGADGFLLLAGGDQASALGGNDALCGDEGNDILNGGGGKDVAVGADGKDKLNGGKGKDRLTGGKGKDRLNGGKGNDKLKGGAGKDRLVGGRGRDTLSCGAGKKDIAVADRKDRVKRSCERVR